MAYTPGKGTELRLTISSTPTALAQVVNITPPAMEMGTTETTHLLSTWREYIANIPDGGTVQFTVEYDSASATHVQLWTSYQAGTLETWAVALNDTGDTTINFSGILTNFGFDQITVDNVVTAPLTIKISGAVTITP